MTKMAGPKSPCRTGSDLDTIQHPMTAAPRLFAASSWAQTLTPKPELQCSRTIDTAGGAPVTQAFRKSNREWDGAHQRGLGAAERFTTAIPAGRPETNLRSVALTLAISSTVSDCSIKP